LGWINNHYNHGSKYHYPRYDNNYSGDNNLMGIHNNIHDYNDDHYYYCTLYDCACDKPLNYYDTSNNYFFKSAHNTSINDNNVNDTTPNDNNHPSTSTQWNINNLLN